MVYIILVLSMLAGAVLAEEKQPDFKGLWEKAQKEKSGELGLKAYCLCESGDRPAMLIILTKISPEHGKTAMEYEGADLLLLKELKKHPETVVVVRKKLKLCHRVSEFPFSLSGTFKEIREDGHDTQDFVFCDDWITVELGGYKYGKFTWNGTRLVITNTEGSITFTYELEKERLVLTRYCGEAASGHYLIRK